MPKKSKTLCVDDLRHAEYYGMQGTFDELYQKSQNGEVFENLMDLILSRDNILLAYRNIKANKGSYTAGTDKKNITDIGSQTPDDVVKRVRKSQTVMCWQMMQMLRQKMQNRTVIRMYQMKILMIPDRTLQM